MSAVQWPDGLRLEGLRREHARAAFRSGQSSVDDWLATKALQHQNKHLSATKVLLGSTGEIAGYYTLATGQVDFSGLPHEIVRHLPKRVLPVAVLAWLGVSSRHQGRGLGRSLLSQALRDCFEAGKVFPFVAVVLDCIDDSAKAFYRRWDFHEIPGHPYRLYLSARTLAAMMGIR